MADKIGGYLRPTTGTFVSCSWQCHRDRPTPSTEPGTDYGVAYGSAVFAPEDGTVVEIKTTTSGATGRFVTIDLSDGQRIRLLHLSRSLVKVGQKVKRGQEVAKSGASGFGKEWGYGAHVHVTLWNRHAYTFGSSATLDFARYIGADNDGGSAAGGSYDQATADIQNSLNRWRGEKLVVDGIRGPATIAAIKRLQKFLGVVVDGIWGPKTNTAYNAWAKQQQTPASPKYHTATVDDLAGLTGNVGGFQKIAHLYGYGKGRPQKEWLDFRWGPGTRAGMQAFLNQNYGGSLAAWLRAMHQYKGNDQWGPVMRAAAIRAEVANYKAL